ncbi:probable tRNA-splicing endonuclease subunit sen54 isoform X1 [Primulina huaijiensis]|uniref:probable tRNA-splicing endonuclease subunit sen54 isoform X1 n=1 Tax=Primulina huaijiensis TaxID=1492673 RepID=UPI003CC72BC2
MEAHDLEILSVVKGEYDCDSDSETFFEDSVDDDELSYGSGDIPKLQYRKEASRALWIDELGMAEVVEKKGKMWTTTGIVRSGKVYCSIEETLFLVEIGALDVLNDDGAPLSVSDMYRKLAEDRSRYGCSWESFEVYRHLKHLGYIVGRHGILWSSKNFKADATVEEGSREFDLTRKNGSISSSFITEEISVLQLSETKPIYDVYPPNSMFKKSSPGSPCFVLYLISGRPPSKQEIEKLEIRCRGNPLKFCIVEHGRVQRNLHKSFTVFRAGGLFLRDLIGTGVGGLTQMN